MSVTHGCTDGMDVVETFKEALKQRVGVERYQLWFTTGVEFLVDSANDSDSSVVMLRVRGQFALERIRKNLLRELRGAAMQATGSAEVQLSLDQPVATQTELPLPGLVDQAEPKNQAHPSGQSSSGQRSRRQRSNRQRSRNETSGHAAQRSGRTNSLSSLVANGAGDIKKPKQRADRPTGPVQLKLPTLSENISDKPTASVSTPADRATSPASAHCEQTFSSFVLGPSNQLAYTAMTMICQDPQAASPLFLCGPTGTGKSHILSAIADQFRRRHRMRRVMLLSAEQFTNDFITSVGNSGITSFRRRYREVDALLIDGIQFLGAKKATLREMLYTVETLVTNGRPLVVSGIQAPTEIEGLTSELSGRLAAGLVCPIQPIDMATREQLLRRAIEQRCQRPMPQATIEQINATLSGDGRVIQGVANLINTLQRMYGRIPTMDELRASKPVATLAVIESAVCQAFQLPADTFRRGAQTRPAQTRTVTEPRMLAMYLSRQLTSSAYAEIARHFGGRSHSTAISAEKNVKKWLDSQKSIGRGATAMSAREAIDRVERLLRSG